MEEEVELTYLEQVRLAVQDTKEERISTYKQYVSDFIIPQMVDDLNGVASVFKDDIESIDANFQDFKSWLTAEGFKVSTPSKTLCTVALP